jgi:hypothetical protein
MIVTPPVVGDCVQQYKTPQPTPTLAPTPASNPNSDEAWDNRWYKQSKEHQEEGAKRAMLWPQLPQEWSDVLHAYYKLKQEDQLDKSGYTPGLHDSDKIKDTIDTLERVKRSQNNAVEAENIDKIIKQLNMDLLYFKIKHGK